MKTIKYSILILFFITIAACEVDSNCGSINVDYVTFSTFSLNENEEEVAAPVMFDSIVSPQAEVIFVSDTSVNSFALPLSPIENQTDFYFYYDSKVDTIIFTYEKRSRIDSPECGIDNEFIGLDTMMQSFDSLIIVNDTLKRTINAPNIKLFI